ncbi:MAG: sugar phosphate isomerase/epimerase family protein [Armatimonadota bacterium]
MAYQLGAFNRPWNQFEYEEALAGISGAGFKYTGLMRQGGEILLDSSTPTDEVENLRGTVEEAGLQMNTVLGRLDFADGVDGAIADLEQLLQNCAAIGASYFLNCGTKDEDLRQDYYTVLREGAEIGKDLGVTVTLKPHGGITTTGDDLLQAAETVNHDNFGIYYDAGNMVHYGSHDPVEAAKACAQYVVGMCVKDSLGQGIGVNILPGEGEVDFEGVMSALAAGGFIDGPLLIECLGGETIEEVNTNALATRKFLEYLVG